MDTDRDATGTQQVFELGSVLDAQRNIRHLRLLQLGDELAGSVGIGFVRNGSGEIAYIGVDGVTKQQDLH